ncbi:MAG: BlaI/MecI/CopY family transcriptional regulator [Proteobacteria bacterium]|nr:BlaI/MecI/CopY family transcriptional regulator [Pseudomonadota bacterium]
MARDAALERRVLDVLWQGGEWSVRQVLAEVDEPLAYTTIATVLDRLHEKGQVQRVKQGVSWQYWAARSKDEALAAEVGRLMARAEAAPEPMLVAFLDQVERVDPDALDRLEALLEARRQRK